MEAQVKQLPIYNMFLKGVYGVGVKLAGSDAAGVS